MEYNFSKRVQEVIRYSREEAFRLGHEFIGTEHLLLGLIKLGEGTAIEILHNLGVELLNLKKAIEEAISTGAHTLTIGNLPLTKQAEKVLKRTQIEVKVYRKSIIGTEHSLLGILHWLYQGHHQQDKERRKETGF